MWYRSRAVWLSALFVAVFAVDLRVRVGGAEVTRTVDDVAQLLAAAAAATAGWWRAHRFTGRMRTSWQLMGLGATSWTIGAAIWLYYEVFANHESPFPSPADAFYLGFAILAGAGLLVRPARAFEVRGRARIGLDSSLIAVSLFAVSWVSVLGRVYEGEPVSLVGTIVSLAYPVSDVALLTVAIVVISYTQRDGRTLLLWVAGGMACFAVADSVYAYLTTTGAYNTGSLIDIGWVTGFLMIACGAVLDARPHKGSEGGGFPSRSALLLPYLPSAIAATVVLGRLHVKPHDWVAVVTLVLIVWLLLVRQAVVLLDNRALLVRIQHQARHDGMTGLANGALFYDRLSHALELRGRDHRALAVLMIDLDDFKAVNDTFGHAAGDELLARVGERLRACVRSSDTPARVGGDEFAVLVEDGSDGLELADRILAVLEDPIVIVTGPITTGGSIGIATVTPGERIPSAREFVHRADLAMYAAKRAGKGTVRMFSAELADIETGQAGLHGALAADLATGNIGVAFQPIQLASGRLYGFEALARWSYRGEAVSPARFLPIARRLGSISTLDRHVLRTALAEAATWDADVVVSVNLDAETLADPTFAGRVAALLEQGRVNPTRLVVEVPEAGVVGGRGAAVDTLEALRALGVRVAVDGLGRTSFAGLRSLRPDIVKIDSCLTDAGGRTQATSILLGGVTQLAHEMGALVVAECIETDSQLSEATSAGCDAVQGYLLGRPGSADECRLALAAQAGDEDLGPTTDARQLTGSAS